MAPSSETSSSEPAETVLIAGAGPVGLALAVGLRRFGVECRLVDKAAARSENSKALGVMPRTLETLGRMGVERAAVAAGHRIGGVCVHVGEHALAEVTFEALDGPHPFVLILPQSETERLLTERLAELGGVVERSVELVGFAQDAAGVTATLRHADGPEETARANWLVGCDGAHSAVRHGLKLEFRGAPYPDAFVLGDVRMEGGLPDDRLSVFLHPDGLLAVFPMGDKPAAAGGRPLWRVVADLPPSSEPVPQPGLAELQAIVEARGPGRVRLSEPVWTSGFRVHRRQVDRDRVGRVFLAGDAAHIHSPAGGQGMNTGIQDAENLAWKLALVVRGDASPDLLDSYGAERHPVASRVLRMTDAMTRAVALRNPVGTFLRNRLLGALNLRPVGRRWATTLAELDVNCRDSPIVCESWTDHRPDLLERGPAPGIRAPDAPLVDLATGAPRTLFDLFDRVASAGPAHTLLLFAGRDATAADLARLTDLAESVRAVQGLVASPALVVTAPPASPVACPTFLDADGTAHARYAATAASLYLIRPDGAVGHRSRPPRLDAAEDYARRLARENAAGRAQRPAGGG